MKTVKIMRMQDSKDFTFRVKDPDALTLAEAKRICAKMDTDSLYVNGWYYHPATRTKSRNIPSE